MIKRTVSVACILFILGGMAWADTSPAVSSDVGSKQNTLPGAEAASGVTTKPAAISYIAPSWADLLRTAVRLKSIDLHDNLLLDEYAIITECSLYNAYYADEFKWNQVRIAVLNQAIAKEATYPLAYHFDVQFQLNHYDFERNLYIFSDKATLSHVNSIIAYDVSGPACGSAQIRYLPQTFQVVFDAPVTVLGLPLNQNTAEALLQQMNSDKNTNKVIYTRLYFHNVYADPLQRQKRVGANTEIEYDQVSAPHHRALRLDAHLDSVLFYEDPAMTRLVYEYKP